MSGNPFAPQAQFQQAMALHQNGRLAEAETVYRQILQSQPRNFDCLHLLGVIAFQTGRHGDAIDLIGRAIALYPLSAAFYANRGNALLELNQLETAIADYDKAISLNPDYAQAYSNRGSAQLDLKRYGDAMASLDRAIALLPDYANAHNNRGRVFQEREQFADALESYDKAIALDPGFARAHNNRGIVLQKLQRQAAALASFDKAISLVPDYAEAYSNRGNALRELSRHDEALASFDKALSLKPDFADACNNRGNALQEMNRLDEALASFDRAIALKGDFPQAFSNRGSVLHDLGRLDDAVASFDRAIALLPDYADAHWNKALTLLLAGDFDQGWRLYEWGMEGGQRGGKRDFAKPLWLGDAPLNGKTILLHSEQGLGDAIQFSRYAADVAALGGRAILEVPEPLVDLLRGLNGVSEILAKGEDLPAFDCHCPLLSLPLAFKTRLDTIQARPAYLHSDAKKRERWAERLGARTKPRVGLVWSGNPDHKRDYNRSIALSRLLGRLPGACDYVSLQKDLRETDAAALERHGNVRHFGEALADFTDTAALCDLMDAVVTVDTGVAHLAGALGRPTYLMLSHVPDWRWLLGRTDSPWYPTMRLCRQPVLGDWDSVIAEVAAELAKLPLPGHPG